MSASASVEVAPRPSLDEATAAALATSLFGVTGPVKELGSHQDRNFLIQDPKGKAVLKIANKGWPKAALQAQNDALLHIAAAKPGFDAPRPLAATAPAAEGEGVADPYIREAEIGGEKLLVRLVTYLDGQPLSGRGYLAPAVIADLGRLAGSVAAVLKDFQHAGLHRPAGQWDLRNAVSVVESLLPSIADAAKRAEVQAVVSSAAAQLTKLTPSLRMQAIHSDVTDDNVVALRDEEGRLRPHGIIDYGDLSLSWLIAELAITCSCVLRHRDEPLAILPAVQAFHREFPLLEEEVAALWPLIQLRGAVLVASGEHQSLLDPDNESATGPLESEWHIFRSAASVPFPVAEAAMRSALGMPQNAQYSEQRTALAAPESLLIPSLSNAGKQLAVLDLSSMSELLHSGKHLKGAEEEVRLLKAAVKGEEAAAADITASATRWAEARFTRTAIGAAAAPATVATGVQLHFPGAGTVVAAPWAGTVAKVEGSSLELDCSAGRMVLSGLQVTVVAGAAVAAGAQLGVSGGEAYPLLHVCVCIDSSLSVPAFVTADYRAAWTSLCPDPSALVFGPAVAAAAAAAGAAAGGAGAAPGAPLKSLAAPDDQAEALLQRRDRNFAKVQEHYYSRPMRVERGWKAHLVDTEGRSYLDMVNNVAAIGHSHPRMINAVHKQLSRLNTNSRFHYAAVAELCEKLAAISPEGLDSVFLVNSGSEAVDLALRMAQVVTGRLDVLAVREAYHGVTMLSDAVTTSLWDNPIALETRPPWVHLASAPNSYRGKFRGAEAAAGYIAEMQETVKGMVEKGTPPAAFIVEPLFGNAGGVKLPEGYLAASYAAVRAAGGICISDEVQVGYGRTGAHWWAHSAHGVKPDMITIAKAMGNGYPLGAVITTKAIAEAFKKTGSFFSSAGGSPVSCTVGSVVLDVLVEEQLQQNAKLVGDRFAERCGALMAKHPMIGAIHGLGLYMGIELVRDRETLEPATKEAYSICDRMRELGVIVQPTGERANVLKMKPPMCLTVQDADFFCDMLDKTLSEGW